MQDRLDKRPIMSSPYLNFDPSILNPAGSPQFIIPEGQGEHRGKMEMAFFTIGSSVSIGGLIGGANGLIAGMKETRNLPPKVRYSQLLNFVGKRGSSSAQSFGGIALMFALYDTVLSYGRDVDDELNIVGSGLLTGVTYSAPHGLKRMAKGGFIGLALTLSYLAYTRRELFASLRFEDKTKNY